MKGYIQEGGASLYDAPKGGEGHKILKLPGGAELEILETHGDFYAVQVFGRSEPAYVYRLEVDMPPELREVAEERDAGEQLAKFVVTHLAEGTSRRSIVAELVKAGLPEDWATNYVEEAHKTLRHYGMSASYGAPAGAPDLDPYLRHMFFGFLWAAGGGLLTLVTYSAASSDPQGGTYYVFYGAMGIGALQFLYGLVGCLAAILRK